MKDSKWPYLAGIIDGEGTLSISKHNKRIEYNVQSLAADVTIVNTDERLMKWLISNFGGRYYTRIRQLQNPEKHKPSFVWRLTGRANKERILLGAIPYMVLKREQAILVLEYIRMGTQKDPAKRELLAAKCQALNKKGPSTPTTNTPNCSTVEQKIEPELVGDYESAPAVM